MQNGEEASLSIKLAGLALLVKCPFTDSESAYNSSTHWKSLVEFCIITRSVQKAHEIGWYYISISVKKHLGQDLTKGTL